MVLDELKSKIDRLWDAFWSNGISNPVEVVDQVTYLLFIRKLDVIQASKDDRHERTGTPVENPIYTTETDYLRWSRFKALPPDRMLSVVRDEVFPWLRSAVRADTTYAHHLRDALLAIPTADLLAKVVDLLDELPLGEGDAGENYTSTCSARSPQPGRAGSSVRPSTSSSSWSR